MEEIKENELNNYGITIKCNVMDNGESRFRLIGKDGSAYIRTESSMLGGWQNSHYHTEIRELYLVQKGTIIFIEYIDNKINAKKLLEGEFCVSEPMVPHNVYMFPNTVTHTIKFGDCSKADWNKCNELDEIIKKCENVADILK